MGVEDLLEHLGLPGRPGAAVEDEAAAHGVALGEAATDHLHHQLVGDQLALVHERLGATADVRAPLDLAAQHVPRGDVGYHVVMG